MICYATIRESSPRYPTWLEVFGTDTVPLESDRSVVGAVPGLDGPRRFFQLDISGLDNDAYAGLCRYVNEHFRKLSAGGDLNIYHCPILAEDVGVSYRGDFYL